MSAGVADSANHGLRIQLLGDFRVVRGDHLITEDEWRLRKARELCKYLVTHRNRWVGRDVLLSLFWPDMEKERSLHNLQVTVYVLRRTLEPELPRGTQSRYVASRHHLYRFSTGCQCVVDTDVFGDAYRAGRQAMQVENVQAALGHFRTAVEAYAGHFLEENLYDDWAATERECWREQYHDALCRLARLESQVGNEAEAIGRLRQVLRSDPTLEDAHRALLRHLVRAGHVTAAIRTHRQLAEYLAREFGATPEPETQALAQDLFGPLRGGQAHPASPFRHSLGLGPDRTRGP